MKRLVALIAMMLVGAPSYALVGLENVSFDGSLEVKGMSANNETSQSKANDRRGVTATRVRVGINADVTEDVKSRLEVTRTPGSAGSAALYGGASKPSSVTTEEGAWVFNNAYVDFGDLWGLWARLGRQYVGAAGDLVWHLGAKDDDALTITSIDGLSVRKAKIADKLDIDVFTGKFRESAASVAATDATSSGDVNLSNLQLTLTNVLPGGNIWAGLLLGNAANTSAENDNVNLNIWRVGVNGGIAENMLTYRAEFLQNDGQTNTAGGDVKFEGNALDLGVGINAPESSAGKFGVWANFVRASGDDNAADNKNEAFSDFTTLGVNTSDRYYGEIFGRSNALAAAAGAASPLGQGLGNGGVSGTGLQVINVGASFKPGFWEKGWIKADWFNLAASEDVSFTDAASGAAKKDDKLGNELDIVLGYDHSDNVGFKVGYAMLLVDDALAGLTTQNTSNDETITEWFARANVKWGGAEK